MQEKLLYEYAIIRVMPDVERGELLNIGLIMMCKRRRWLRAEIVIDAKRLAAVAPQADAALLAEQTATFTGVARGLATAGPMAVLPAEERFRWLTAMRSACLRTSPPHPGLTADLDATFERLMDRLVR